MTRDGVVRPLSDLRKLCQIEKVDQGRDEDHDVETVYVICKHLPGIQGFGGFLPATYVAGAPDDAADREKRQESASDPPAHVARGRRGSRGGRRGGGRRGRRRRERWERLRCRIEHYQDADPLSCGASRHYVRDDRRRTMGDWAPWSGHKLAEPESR